MNLVLLSGGSGQRLWPLSNDVRSKQFIKISTGPMGNWNPWSSGSTGKSGRWTRQLP